MRKAVVILLSLLAAAIVGVLGVLVLAPNFVEHTTSLSMSSLIAGVGIGGSASSSATSSALAGTQRISHLEQEVERLKEALAQQQAAKGGRLAAETAELSTSDTLSDTTVNIDLMKFLGLQSFFAGVSWDPFACLPPPKTVWPKINDEALKEMEAKIVQALTNMMARVRGVDPKHIDPSQPYHPPRIPVPLQLIDPAKPYHQQFDHDDMSLYITDPAFTEWRSNIMVTLSPYAANAWTVMHVKCSKTKDKKVYPEDLGTPDVDCTSELSVTEIIDQIGYYAMPYESITAIAHGYVTVGICTSQLRDHAASYAHWIRKERVFTPAWKTFSVETLDQDAVVLLFDLLYEKLAIFTRQYWLGVITMQNPFDMYSIQDILFVTRPTLMIETGTANGGSALLWASIMELSDMNTSRIITIDMNVPKWEAGVASWGGKARDDPTQHKLWKKFVTFIQGGTTDEATVKQVKAAAEGQKVMVLLDSHHQEEHVTGEMERYCPLVSVGCYCIIEDTKMSRWASSGPMESVTAFMAGPHGKKFEVVRDRELLYSHHAKGYLKRIR